MDNGKPPKQTIDQARRFVETARALGCDEDETAFDEKLKRIAGYKPDKATPPPASRPANPAKRKARPKS